MIKNVYFDRKKHIHLWESYNGESFYDVIPWVPYIFVKTDKDSATHVTMDGQYVVKKEFENYKAYKDFNEKYGKQGFIYENYVKPEIQFLVDRTYGINDEDIKIPELKVYYIDIEVHKENGFPNIEKAEDPIVAITIVDSLGETYTWGIKPYDGKNYFHYSDEQSLLKSFLWWSHKNPPDVLSGWNCYGFDIPYIMRRCDNLNIDCRILSPINEASMWRSKIGDRNIDIAGITILDYLQLYKRLGDNLESYSLDVVANHVLKKGKLDYSQEYESLSHLYERNWKMYIEYNRLDAELVRQIENKCQFIKLTYVLSLLTRCPMKYTDSQTSLIEGAMLTWLRRNGMCAPRFTGGHKEDFAGGFVCDPKPGIYNWVFSVDIQSSYPSHIIALNMSPETFIGVIDGFTEKEIMTFTQKREFPEFKINDKQIFGVKLARFNEALREKKIAIAPNGSVFSTTKPGTLARFQRDYFEKRIEYKNKMKTDVQNKDYWNTLQVVIKRILNSFYGATSVEYSRYHNINVSKAITACGRQTLKAAIDYTNRFGDIVLYGDTDSLYCHFEPLALSLMGKEKWASLEEKEKIAIINEFLGKYQEMLNHEIFNTVQCGYYNSNVTDFKIKFVPERICYSAIFVMKKKYAIYDKDGVNVKGLEIVRSDTPISIKEKLRDIMGMLLKGYSDTEISEKIKMYIDELKTVSPEEIASNISVNGVGKYSHNEMGHKKGAPMAVKAIIYTNKFIQTTGIDHQLLQDGTKTKVAYLQTPNRYNMDTIAFYKWKNFEKYGIYIDYNKMIEKFFIKKIESLVVPINKKHILCYNYIDDFFV